MAKRQYSAIPYNKIEKLWMAGKSYEAIGKAVDRLASKGDTTKPVRAIVSRMLNEGWNDENGHHTLKLREGMRNIGAGKKLYKGKKKAVVAKAVGTGKRGRPAVQRPVLINLMDGGQFIRVSIEGKAESTLSSDKVATKMIKVLDTLGYDVIKKEVTDPAADSNSVALANPVTPKAKKTKKVKATAEATPETTATETPATEAETPKAEETPAVETVAVPEVAQPETQPEVVTETATEAA